jgi:hypothetical protein
MAAKTVYVRSTGDNANSGLTEALAKLTIAGANVIAAAGDTVDVGAGSWSEAGEFGKTSSVIYQGAGMYSTTINSNIVGGATVNSIMKNCKIVLQSMPAANLQIYSINWSRLLIDGGGATHPAAYPWLYFTYVSQTYKFQSCIFHKITVTTTSLFAISVPTVVVKVYNCIFYKTGSTHCDFYDYSAGVPASFTYRNNIVHTSATPNYIWDGINPSAANLLTLRHNNNIFYLPPTYNFRSSVYGSQEYLVNPLFTDPENYDYRLASGSPAIGKGTINTP